MFTVFKVIKMFLVVLVIYNNPKSWSIMFLQYHDSSCSKCMNTWDVLVQRRRCVLLLFSLFCRLLLSRESRELSRLLDQRHTVEIIPPEHVLLHPETHTHSGLCDMDKKTCRDFFDRFCDFDFNHDFDTHACFTVINAFSVNLKRISKRKPIRALSKSCNMSLEQT